MSDQEWDIALSAHGAGQVIMFTFPRVISDTISERGLWRAKLTITDEGLLVTPYPSPRPSRGEKRNVELPESWGRLDTERPT